MLYPSKFASFVMLVSTVLLLKTGTTLAQKPLPDGTSQLTPVTIADSLQKIQVTVVQQDTIEKLAAAKPGPQTIKAFLKKGKFSGQVRNFFMATDNTGNYPDYHALALGTGLTYESAQFHGFRVGVGGFFVFNVWSNNLGTDPATGLNSRYEIGNFDLLDPKEKQDLGRLEYLYLSYNHHKSKATIGRQKISTPFLNPQDGRMHPSLVNGLWLEINELEKLSFQGGLIYSIGPRSTQDWFSVEESIGSIPVGRSALGGPSQFKGNISSRGIAVGNVTYKPAETLTTSLWHYYADNLFNFTFSQTDVNIPVSPDKKQAVVLGVQAGYQAASGDGGNKDPRKAYIVPGSETWLYSGRLGYKTPLIATSLNFTRIADGGRFLFPREWGIETFYTFMPRERLEGTANTTAIALITDISLNKQWKARISYGRTKMPDVKNLEKNKYGMPSYSQLQLMSNYSFKGLLDGLSLQALYIYKGSRANTYDTPNFIVNKVDMSHYTFVMNYNF